MTTVIRASNSTFTNTNLPVITPILKDGLVAAFRPSKGSLGSLDLSGNGHTFSSIGSPEFTEFGVRGNGDNGLLTDVPETLDLTMVVSCRLISGESGGIVGNYFNPTNKEESRGSSMYLGSAEGEVRLSGQVISSQDSITTPVNRYFQIASTSKNIDTGETPLLFAAFTINTLTQEVHSYSRTRENPFKKEMDFNQLPQDLTQRNLTSYTDPSKPNYLRILNSEDTATFLRAGVVEVVEVLFYDRALSLLELDTQYAYSKKYAESIGLELL